MAQKILLIEKTSWRGYKQKMIQYDLKRIHWSMTILNVYWSGHQIASIGKPRMNPPSITRRTGISRVVTSADSFGKNLYLYLYQAKYIQVSFGWNLLWAFNSIPKKRGLICHFKASNCFFLILLLQIRSHYWVSSFS